MFKKFFLPFLILSLSSCSYWVNQNSKQNKDSQVYQGKKNKMIYNPIIGSLISEEKIALIKKTLGEKAKIKTDSNGNIIDISSVIFSKTYPDLSPILGDDYECKLTESVPNTMGIYICKTKNNLNVRITKYGTIDMKSLDIELLK